MLKFVYIAWFFLLITSWDKPLSGLGYAFAEIWTILSETNDQTWDLSGFLSIKSPSGVLYLPVETVFQCLAAN